VWAAAAGVRFDASPLPEFEQYIDLPLLKHDLLRSLYFLHSQPPLYNLWLGVNVKLFPASFATAAHAQYIVLGLLLALLLYVLVWRLGGRRWIACVVTILVTISPPVLLYENWLFYEYPVAVFLLISVAALDLFLFLRDRLSGFLFCSSLVLLVGTRATFQLPWLLLVLLLLVALLPGVRRVVLVSCAVPLAAVVLLYAKNIVVFGVPSTSSWAGMNLAQVAYWKLSDSTREKLIKDGTLSQTSAADPFSRLDDYADYVARTHDTVPVLAAKSKENGAPNYNHRAYVAVSKRYFRDSLRLIWARPGIYLDGVAHGLWLSLQPSTDDVFVLKNRAKIRSWDRLYNDAVFWRTPYFLHLCIALVLAYLAAAFYGVALARRLVRGDRRNMTILLGYIWLTWAYVALLVTFGEVSENQRIRFILDPLTLLLLVAAARDLAEQVRLRHRMALLRRAPFPDRP
jgi:hypothetical protein